MKKIIMIIVATAVSGAAHAAGCPTGFDEIPMENIQVTVGDETCAKNSDGQPIFEKYYEINEQCTAHILD